MSYVQTTSSSPFLGVIVTLPTYRPTYLPVVLPIYLVVAVLTRMRASYRRVSYRRTSHRGYPIDMSPIGVHLS
jgi:hypothetical protein